MKLHELQDRLSSMAKHHGNIDVVLIDPTVELTPTAARWTSAIGLYVAHDATDDDGSPQSVLLLIPNPEKAMTVGDDGAPVAIFDARGNVK